MTVNSSAPHHAGRGFRNPFPSFQKKGLAEFARWMVKRGRNGLLREKEAFHPGTAANDGSFLKSNRTAFTVTWIGHSTVLVQLGGVNILMDPIWSDRASPVSWAGPKRYTKPGIPFEALPDIHVVLVSHDHYDHLDRRTVKRLGGGPLYLVPLGVGGHLRRWGIGNFRELDWWETVSFEGMEFTCTPAQHFSGRGLFDHDGTLWCGWAVRGAGGSFYFAGDTGYFPGFREIGERLGDFDVACLPIGAYVPRWFMGSVHLGPAEAIRAFHDLNGGIFVGIHWGTFELAEDPPGLPPMELRREIRERGLPPSRFWLLKLGETRLVDGSAPGAARERM